MPGMYMDKPMIKSSGPSKKGSFGGMTKQGTVSKNKPMKVSTGSTSSPNSRITKKTAVSTPHSKVITK